MEKPDYIVVFVTANTAEEAQQIATLLLEQRQAACVNIIPEVASRFWWEGKIDTAQESLLVIKTRTLQLPEIIKLVKGIQSNTVPEIIALPVVGGNQDYLDWIDKEVA
ncbi:divalent-cation tolerance protein CutA [Chloroflexota bacterium]